MAITAIDGFESRTEDSGPNGTSSYDASIVRSGLTSLRCNPASGASGYISHHTSNPFTAAYLHWGVYIATMPSVARVIAGQQAASTANILLNTDGTLTLRDNTTTIGTSSTALITGQWYWIGWKNIASTTGVLLQIDGVDQVSGTQAATAAIAIGARGTEASAIDMYIDDIIAKDDGFLSPSKVATLFPISDNSRTNWTAGAGGTTNLWDAADNVPPAGVASASETNTTNIESGSNTGTANYIANMTTYATAGIASTDTVLGVRLVVRHGEDINTGTKTGSFESTGNPVIASTTFTFGDDLGAHGAESGGLWSRGFSTVSSSPSVTVGNSMTMKVIKTDTTTRTGCVSQMAALVAWTPAAVTSLLIPHRHRGLIIR